MWDYDPPPYVQFSIFMYIVLIPYIDNVLVFLWGCMGKEERMACASWDGYSPCTLCFLVSGRAWGKTMFVTYDLLSPYEMSYLHLMRILEEQDIDGGIGEHLAYGGILSCVGVTKEEIL